MPSHRATENQPFRKIGGKLLLVACFVVIGGVGVASGQETAAVPAGSLQRYTVTVTALQLSVEPGSQTIPAGVPAAVRTVLSVTDPNAAWASGLLAYVRSAYRVKAELYADGNQAGFPRTVEGAPDGELLLGRAPEGGGLGETFPEPGVYTLRNIRLVEKNTGRLFMYADPAAAAVRVGGDLFVATVETRPLTWQEIQDAGLLLDDGAWNNYNFTVGFELGSEVVEYDFPVVSAGPPLPMEGFCFGDAGLGEWVDSVGPILPVELDLRGIPIPQVSVPAARLPGLIIIPGNVGYLRQHFEVVLVLCNALPPESGARLSAMTGEIDLGPDGPLELPSVSDWSNTPLQAVLGNGGASDLLPSESGRAKWYVRAKGNNTGYFEFPIHLRGKLKIAAGGAEYPVDGEARGGVVVRPNPRFAMTFVHPDRVERNVDYEVAVHVTNVSSTAANGFRVGLQEGQLSGVAFQSVRAPGGYTCQTMPCTYQKDTLQPGETVILTYRFRSLRSGMVVAAYGNGDAAGVEVGVQLRFGISADGVPMNPDTLILPPSAKQLGDALYEKVLAFVGMCHVLSRTAAADIPLPLGAVRPSSVRALAEAAAEAGLYLQAGMGRGAALALLLHDIMTTAVGDGGVRRAVEALGTAQQPLAGRVLVDALVAELKAEAGAAGLAAALIAAVGGEGDFGLVQTALPRTAGPAVLLSGADGLYWLPAAVPAAGCRWGNGAGSADFQLYRRESSDLARAWQWTPVLAAADEVVVSASLATGAANLLTVENGLTGATSNLAGTAVGSVALIAPVAGQALKINPAIIRGADPFGRSVVLVCNRRVKVEPKQAGSLFTAPRNGVLTARSLGSGRLVGVAFNKPAGKFRPAPLQAGGLKTWDGLALPPVDAAVVVPDPASAWERGATVAGEVVYPDGRPVPTPRIELWAVGDLGTDTCVSLFQGGEDGAFSFDFIPDHEAGMYLVVTDPAGGARRHWPLRLDGGVEELRPRIVLFGTGGLQGQLVDEAGAPTGGLAAVVLQCRGDGRQLRAVLTANGQFSATGVTVGDVDVTAYLTDGSRLKATVVIRRAGEVAHLTLVVGTAAVTVDVRETGANGALPVPNARVSLTNPQSGGCYGAQTDAEGKVVFARVGLGTYTVQAHHPTKPKTVSTNLVVAGGGHVGAALLFTGGANLTGRVRVAATGGTSALPFAQVALERQGGGESLPWSLQANSSGVYQFRDASPGFYRVVATRPSGAGTAATSLYLAEGDNQAADLVFAALVGLQGRVESMDGTPRPDAVVQFGESTVGGVFDLAVEPGLHRYLARRGQDEVEVGSLTAPATQALIRLRGKRRISGTVVNAQGQPVTVPVALQGMKLHELGSIVTYFEVEALGTVSAVNGTFQFDGVWDGPFSVSYGGGAFYGPAKVGGTLAGQDAADLRLVLPEVGTGALSGTLLARGGAAPAGAGLTVALNTPFGGREARTDEAGHFLFPAPLAKGNYTLEAENPWTGDRAWQEIYFPATGDQSVTLTFLGKGTIQVEVFDAAGVAIEEARVSLSRRGEPAVEREAETVWDSDATEAESPRTYRFNGLFAGLYTVRARRVSGETVEEASGSVELLGDGATAKVTLVFGPTVAVQGTVRAFTAGVGFEPVPGVEVSLLDQSGKALAVAVTSFNLAEVGVFQLPPVTAGRFQLAALDYGTGRRALLAVDLSGASPGSVHDFTLDLEEPGVVQGVVRPGRKVDQRLYEKGILADVTLRVVPQPGSPYPAKTVATRTAVDGSFRFEGVPAGEVVLEARDAGNNGASAAGTLTAGATLALDVTLQPTADVQGFVLAPGSGDEPAPWARVELRNGPLVRATVTDDNGAFAFPAVIHGEYAVSAWSGSGLNKVVETITVPAGGPVTLRLNRVGAVKGRGSNHSATRFPGGAAVTLQLSQPDLAFSVATDADGYFFFPEIPLVADASFTATLVESASGLEGAVEGVVPAAGDLRNLTVKLEPSFNLFVKVFDELGGELSSVPVLFQARRPDGRLWARQVDFPLFGFFQLHWLPQLSGRVAAGAPGLGWAAQTIDPAGIPDEGDYPQIVNLVLDKTPPAVLGVRFFDAAGTCPPEAVALDAQAEIAFSESVDAAWLAAHPDCLRLEQHVPGSGWARIAAEPADVDEGRRWTLAPAALPGATRIRVVVCAGVPDRVGNAATTETTAEFTTVDNVPPVVVGTIPANGAIEVDVASLVKATFSEPLAVGAGTVLVTRDGVPVDNVGVSLTDGDTAVLLTLPGGGLSSDARYLATLEGWQDRAGNPLAAPYAFRFETHDTQPPTVAGSFCGTTQLDPEGLPTLELRLFDALRGIDVDSIATPTINGTPAVVTEKTAERVVFHPTQALSDGPVVVALRVADQVAGNVRDFACSFTLQRHQVVFVAHEPSAAVVLDTAPLTVGVTFQSAYPPAATQLLINGAVQAGAVAVPDGGGWRLQTAWDPSEGPVSVEARVTDDHGYTAPPYAFSFRWDGHAPSLTLEVPAAPDCAGRPTLSFSCQDAGTGVQPALTIVLVDGQDRTAAFAVTAAGGSWRPPEGAELASGSHLLHVEVSDNAGLNPVPGHTTVQERVFYVDEQGRAVVVDSPSPNQNILTDVISFDIQVSDPCGVDWGQVSVALNGAACPDFAFAAGRVTVQLPWNDSRLVMGPNVLTVQAMDLLGNAAEKIVPFRIVRTASLPCAWSDANGYDYALEEDGRLDFHPPAGGSRPSLAAPRVYAGGQPYAFPAATQAELTLSAREAAVGGELAGLGLTVRRRVYVAPDGYAARVLDVLENPGATPVSVDVETVWNLPAALGWLVTGTSDGLPGFDPSADAWLTVDDAVDADDAFLPNLPALGLLTGRRSGREAVAALGADGLSLRWNGVAVPAGTPEAPGRAVLLLALTPQPERAAAAAALARLGARPAELFPGLSGEEQAACWNHDLSAGANPGLPDLPALDGGVAGTLFDGAGHPCPDRRLLLRSAAPFYRRARVVATAGDGAFHRLPPNDPGQFQPPRLPLAEVELLLADGGDCPPRSAGSVSLTVDEPVRTGLVLAAAGAGAVHVTVRLDDGTPEGAPLGEVAVRLSAPAGDCVYEARTAADGTVLLSGVPEGEWNLRAASTDFPPLSVSAGTTVERLVTFSLPYLAVEARHENGSAAVGARVSIFAQYHQQAPVAVLTTGLDGRAVWLVDHPGSYYDVAVVAAEGGSDTTTAVFVPVDQGVTENVLIWNPVSLTVQARTREGWPIPGAAVSLKLSGWDVDAAPDGTPLETDAAGNWEVPAPSVGYLDLIVTFPGYSPQGPLKIWLGSQGQTLVFTPDAGFYTVTGVVRAADGTTPVFYGRVNYDVVLDEGLFQSVDTAYADQDGLFATRTPVFLPSGRIRFRTPHPFCQGSAEEDVLVVNAWEHPAGSPAIVPTTITCASGAVGGPVDGTSVLVTYPPNPGGCVPNSRLAADGTFAVLGLQPGQRYELQATTGTGASAAIYCGSVELPSGGPLYASGLTLAPCAVVEVTGRALAADGASGVPYAGLTLEVADGAGGWRYARSGQTAADGSFSFSRVELPAARGRLVLSRPASQGGGPDYCEFTAEQAQSPLNVPTGVTVVSGRVVDGNGNPAAGAADLRAQPRSELAAVLASGSLVLNADGTFRAIGLRPGESYWFSARSGAAPVHAAVATLGAGESWRLDVALPPVVLNGTGTVRAADGLTPVPAVSGRVEAKVLVQDHSGSRYVWQSLETFATGEDGAFAFAGAGAPLGLVRAVVALPATQQESGDDLSGEYDLLAGGLFQCDTRVTVVSGDVLDADGRLLPGAGSFTVASDPPGAEVHRARLENGHYTVLGLPFGKVFVLRAEDGGVSCCATVSLSGTARALVQPLTPCDLVTVSGTAYAADGLTPAFGVSIALEAETAPETWEFRRSTVTANGPDDPGRFRFDLAPEEMPTGRLQLVVIHPYSQGGCQDLLTLAGPPYEGVSVPTRITVLSARAEEGGAGVPLTNPQVAFRDGWWDGLDAAPVRVDPADASRLTVLGLPLWENLEVLADRAGGGAGLLAADVRLTDPAGSLDGVVLAPEPPRVTVTAALKAADGLTALPAGFPVLLQREVAGGGWRTAGQAATDGSGQVLFDPCRLPTGRFRLFLPWPSSQGPGGDAWEGVSGGQAQVHLDCNSGVAILTGRADPGDDDLVLLSLCVRPHEADGRPLHFSVDSGENSPQVVVGGLTFQVFGLRPGVRVDLVGETGFGSGKSGQATRLREDFPVVAAETVAASVGSTTLVSADLPSLTVHLRAADGQSPVQARLDLYEQTPDGLEYLMTAAPRSDEGGPVFGDRELLRIPAENGELRVLHPESQGGGPEVFPVDLAAGSAILVTGVTAVSGGFAGEEDPAAAAGKLRVSAHNPAGSAPSGEVLWSGDFLFSGFQPGAGYTFSSLYETPSGPVFRAQDLIFPAGQAVVAGLIPPVTTPVTVSGTIRAAAAPEMTVGNLRLRLWRLDAGGAWLYAAEGESASGGFALGPVPPPPGGSLRLEAFRLGTDEAVGDWELPGPVFEELTLVADVNAVRATVVGGGGAPAASDCLWADAAASLPHTWPVLLSALTQGSTATFVGLPTGVPVDLLAWDGALGFYAATLTLPPGAGLTEGLVLSPADPGSGEVRLHVVDAAGQDRAGLPLTLSARGGSWGQTAVTDAGGRAIFASVPAGSFEIWADLPTPDGGSEFRVLVRASRPLNAAAVDLSASVP